MRVLLRDRRRGLYYTGRNQAAASPEDALDFGTVPGAARFAFEAKLRDVEIVLHYRAPGAEVPLPLLPEWCLFDERVFRMG